MSGAASDRVEWRPGCSLETARFRRDLIDRIRSFFRERGALEVETPVMSRASGCDPHLDWFETESFVDGGGFATRERRFLMTSPEFHMKRLLAAGWGDIWQLTRAFRNGDRGERHAEEFAVLEWYRMGWTGEELMEEVAEVCRLAVDLPAWETVTYREAFLRYAGCDPFDPDGVTAPTPRGREIFEESCRRCRIDAPEIEGEERLHWLHGAGVAPRLGRGKPQFLIEWPAEQAALAKIKVDSEGRRVGERFELYLNGVELCNGYRELIDVEEQTRRFAKETDLRRALGKRETVIDHRFLEALRDGVGECSGVALGFDRLVMAALNRKTIAEVVSFIE